MHSEYDTEVLLSKQQKLKPQLASKIWAEFVKWSYYTFEQERHFSFGKIGNYGYKIEEKNGKKVPFLFISDSFLKQHNLTNRYRSVVMKPVVKINLQAIDRHLENTVSEEDIKLVIETVVETL